MKLLVLLFIMLYVAGCNPTGNNTSTGKKYINHQPTPFPDRIMLTIPGDPATSRAVTWRTDWNTTVAMGQIAIQSSSPYLEKSAQTIYGSSNPWETGSSDAMGHRVVFEELEPETGYVYRVGDGSYWSEWIHFKTSSSGEDPFSFIYLGDVQDSLKTYCSRILRQAYSHFPGADFMLFAGDLVSRSYEEYWRDYFYAGGWIFGAVPSVPTPGNHEYYKDEEDNRTFSNHWHQIFTLPGNGPSPSLRNRTYCMDYQGVRFVSIDSPAMAYSDEDADATITWLEDVLGSNPYRWTIVFSHFPVFSCSQGRDNSEYREAVKPIFEKYGVDLVLQGHDHTYCRGQNLPEVDDNCLNPPVYVVSVAGAKMYGLSPHVWSDRYGSQTQFYQYVTIDGNILEYEAYTVTGDLYDAFTIEKDNEGFNHFSESELVESLPVYTGIPEDRIGRYSEEELKLYQDVFNN